MNVLAVENSTRYSVGLTLLAGLPLFTLLPLGLDFFLPAVYQIGEYFNSQTVPALAINVYMLFWGLGQLFWGGVADAMGKKRIAIIGLISYTLSSYMISGVEPGSGVMFLSFRALQSFGGSACFTAIFALIRTRFDGEELNTSYSYLNGILAFIPVSSPLIGAYIVERSSWLFLFTLMALLGLCSVVWIMLSIPNDKQQATLESSPQPQLSMAKRYWSVVSNARFRTYLLFAVVDRKSVV